MEVGLIDLVSPTIALYGRIHTGSASVPDSSEPNASGRLRVGFAFTLLTPDPTRTVRVRFAVYTLRLLTSRTVVIQLHVLNSWHISRFSGHVPIVSRVDHVLTKETYGNPFSAVIWPILLLVS